MSSSAFNVQLSKGHLLRNPNSANRNFRGFAYIALLVVIIIIGISLGAAGKYWSNVMLRDKEEELLYRGDQYRRAIEHYVSAIPGRQDYPQSIEDLLKDDRTATGKRHLRQKYKDPISGEDFVEIRNTLTKRIIGVHSPSEKEPLKKAGFPDVYNTTQVVAQPGFPESYNIFSDKMKYSEWLFVANIKSAQTPTTGTRPVLTRSTPTFK
jgi:type II secretory pathway pseudopilin PulG